MYIILIQITIFLIIRVINIKNYNNNKKHNENALKTIAESIGDMSLHITDNSYFWIGVARSGKGKYIIFTTK